MQLVSQSAADFLKEIIGKRNLPNINGEIYAKRIRKDSEKNEQID